MKRGRIDECISSVIAKTTMLAQSSSLSPADKVAFVDDLLREILLRLPVRSLLRFKSVSKHWYFLITSPSFKLLRSRNPDPPSGLFVPIRTNKLYLEYEFVSFDIQNPVKSPFTSPNFDPNIEHSSNGLMLCSRHNYDVIERTYVYRYKCYVYNPTINQFITLPMFENYVGSKVFGMAIAFDPSKSSDYRIICVCDLGNDIYETNFQIEIFSSTTRTWKPSCQFLSPIGFDLDFGNGLYWNNAVHWIQYDGYVLYFNLDEETIHEKPTPLGLLGLDVFTNRIFVSWDQLLLFELEMNGPSTSKFKIHELKRDYSEWTVKYHIDLEEVGRSFPEIRHLDFPTKFEYVVLSIVLGEKEEDSFLVLEVPGKALRFNIVTKTFYKLHDLPASRYIEPNRVFSGSSYVHPFVESLYSL